MMRPAKVVLSEVQEQLELATSKYGSLMERLNTFKKLSEQSIATTEAENNITTENNCLENEENIAITSGTYEGNGYDLAPGEENDEFLQPNEGLLEGYGIEDPNYFLQSSDIEYEENQLQFQQFAYNTKIMPLDEFNPQTVSLEESGSQFDNQAEFVPSQSQTFETPISWETQSLNDKKLSKNTEDSCSLKESIKKKRAVSIRTSHSSQKLRLQRIYRGVQKKNKVVAPSRWREVKRNNVDEKKVEPKRENKREEPKKKSIKTNKTKSKVPLDFKQRFPNLDRLSQPKQRKDLNETTKENPKENIEKPPSPALSVAESNATSEDRPKPIFDGIQLDDIVPSDTKPSPKPISKKKEDSNKQNVCKKIIYEKIKETESSEYFEPQLVIHNADNRPSFEWANIGYKESSESLKDNDSHHSQVPKKKFKRRDTASELNVKRNNTTKQRLQLKNNLISKIEPLSVLTSSSYQQRDLVPKIKNDTKNSLRKKENVLEKERDVSETSEAKVNFKHKVSPRIALACKGLSSTLLLAERTQNDNIDRNEGKSDCGCGDSVASGRRREKDANVRPWNAGSGLRDRISRNNYTMTKKKDLFPHVLSRVVQFMGKENRQIQETKKVVEEKPEVQNKKEMKKTVNKPAKIAHYGTLTKENVQKIAKQHKDVNLQRDSISEKNFVKKPEQILKKPFLHNPPRTAPHQHELNEIPKTRLAPDTKYNNTDQVRTHHLHGGGDTERIERNRSYEIYEETKSSFGLIFPSSGKGRQKSIYNTIPFIVGQSVSRSHNLGLSIQETLAALRAKQPANKEKQDNFEDLKEIPAMATTCRKHTCPAMESSPPQIDSEDVWAVPQRDPYENPVPPKRNICTCYSRNSKSLSTVIREFLIQMVGNKFEEEQSEEKKELMIVPTGCQERDLPSCDNRH